MKTATLVFDIGEDGVTNIRVTAENPEDRAAALEKIRQVLPSLELLEHLLTDDSSNSSEQK